MKAAFFKLLLLFLPVLLITSCESDDVFSSEFAVSFETWQRLRDELGNSYEFNLQSSSVFGFGSTTTITVENGVITTRAFERYEINFETQERIITQTFIENEDALNSNPEGFRAMTLDDVYNACDRDILTVDPDTNFITFTTAENGLLEVCSFFPKNCQDDCSVGFQIGTFTPL